MNRDIQGITREMAVELSESGRINVKVWVGKYPEIADQIIDTAIWLKGGAFDLNEEALIDEETLSDEHSVAELALRHACRAQFASSYPMLAIELKTVRESRMPSKPTHGAPAPFKRAVVYAWTAGMLSHHNPRVTRLATQKCVYILEQALALNLFTKHSQMKLGPYDRTAKYIDAEPIARKKKWIGIFGAEIRPGPQLSEVADYAPRYLRSPKLAERLINILGTCSDAELETLATVKAVANDLIQTGQPVNANSVRECLTGLPVWKPKLSKANFSPLAIYHAISTLSELQLLNE